MNALYTVSIQFIFYIRFVVKTIRSHIIQRLKSFYCCWMTITLWLHNVFMLYIITSVPNFLRRQVSHSYKTHKYTLHPRGDCMTYGHMNSTVYSNTSMIVLDTIFFLSLACLWFSRRIHILDSTYFLEVDSCWPWTISHDFPIDFNRYINTSTVRLVS